MNKNVLMIGVSTEQSTTNLIPALMKEFGVTEVLMLETSLAHEKGWNDGLYAVLQEKGIHVLKPIVLSKEQDSRIDLISNEIKTRLHQKGNTEILWNLGGGQKAQQFPLWSIFMERKKDTACYTNPRTHKVEIWKIDAQEKLQQEVKPYDLSDTGLKTENVLKLYGFEGFEGTCIYKHNSSYEKFQTLDLIDFDEFREYLFKLSLISFNANENDGITIKEIKDKLDNSKPLFTDEVKKILTSNYNIASWPVSTKSKYLSEIVLKQMIEPLHSVPKKKRKKELNDATKQSQERIEIISKTIAKNITEKSSYIFGQKRVLSAVNVGDKALREILESNNLEPNRIEVDRNTLKSLTNYEAFSFYFEEVLAKRFQKILEENKHHILEVYSNIKVKKVKQKGTKAEYDLLILTKWGTLIALDAKTYSFDGKDADARLLNLRKIGGRFVDFIAIYPYFSKDMEKSYVSEKLKKLPVSLKNMNVKGYVISDFKSQERKVEITGQEVALHNFENFLAKEKLLDDN